MFLLLMPSIGSTAEWHDCPSPQSLYPCECNATSGVTILCGKTFSVNDLLKQIFQESSRELKSKHRLQNVIFSKFIFKNSIVDQILSHTLDAFAFVELEVRNNDYLRTIDHNAFYSTYNVTDRVHFESNPSLGLKSESVTNLFQVLSQFRNATLINVIDCGLTFIPDYAFILKNGVQSRLQRVSLAKNRIKSVGNFAMANLPNIKYLSLHMNLLEELSKLSLVISESSDHIFIDFSKNRLTSSSFDSEALAAIHRPFDLQLSDNMISYLNESVFKHLFAKSITINLWRNPINCSDCRMKWTSNEKLCGHSNNTISYSQRIDFQCKLFKDNFRSCQNSSYDVEDNPLPCPLVSRSDRLHYTVFINLCSIMAFLRFVLN